MLAVVDRSIHGVPGEGGTFYSDGELRDSGEDGEFAEVGFFILVVQSAQDEA